LGGRVRTGLELELFEVLFVLSEQGEWWGGWAVAAIDSNRAYERTDICTHYCYYLMLVSLLVVDTFIIPFY
jgi:hypothetical protein